MMTAGLSTLRLFLALAIAGFLSACGGGSSNTTQNSGGTNGGIPPAVQPINLRYPGGFPHIQALAAGLSVQAISVTGMTPNTSYEFSYTTTSADVKLLIINTVAPGSFVCTAFTADAQGVSRCTGTVTGDGVAMNAGNFSAQPQSITLDIKPSTVPPSLNEGSEQNPVILNANNDFPYSGTVGGNGDSYYQVINLTIGSRYSIAISNATDNIDLNAFEDAFTTPLKCDPNYSGDIVCNFVSESDNIHVNIDGQFAFAGASFDITLNRHSDAGDFEGTWHSPMVLDVNALPRIGIVDNFQSYYRFDNLDTGRYYTLEFTSKIDRSELGIFDPVTGVRNGNITCNPGALPNATSNSDDLCTFLANGSSFYLAAEGYSQAPSTRQFIMKVTPGPLAEGAISTPVTLSYPGGILRHSGSVDTDNSYYRITGITPGDDYMVRLSGNDTVANTAQLTVFDGDNSFTTAVNCTVTNQFGLINYCITTAISDTFYVRVNGPATPPGSSYTLNVSPVPIREVTADLPLTDLPYAGQTNDFNSEYTITGLTPNTYYIVGVTDVVGIAEINTWPVSASVIGCMTVTRSSGGCLINTGSDSAVNVRIRPDVNGSDNNEPGGFFNLNIDLAPIINADFSSTDTPLAIPNNIPAGVNSQITVSGSPIGSIAEITIEVFIEHGYTPDVAIQLTAPDGTVLQLAENLPNSAYINTRFNDYADGRIDATGVNDLRINRTFRAPVAIHQLNGLDANGIWTLTVADDADSNISTAMGGILHGWGLSFK